MSDEKIPTQLLGIIDIDIFDLSQQIADLVMQFESKHLRGINRIEIHRRDYGYEGEYCKSLYATPYAEHHTYGPVECVRINLAPNRVMSAELRVVEQAAEEEEKNETIATELESVEIIHILPKESESRQIVSNVLSMTAANKE